MFKWAMKLFSDEIEKSNYVTVPITVILDRPSTPLGWKKGKAKRITRVLKKL
jgi:hypothetical protein